MKKQLKAILKRGVMSPMLREAVTSTIEALDKGNDDLAYQLTVCKSYIVAEIDPDDESNAFQEAAKDNTKIFGESLYRLLDGIHFQLAMKGNHLPSGMSVFSGQGVEEMHSTGVHPVIKRIIAEHEGIAREAAL